MNILAILPAHNESFCLKSVTELHNTIPFETLLPLRASGLPAYHNTISEAE